MALETKIVPKVPIWKKKAVLQFVPKGPPNKKKSNILLPIIFDAFLLLKFFWWVHVTSGVGVGCLAMHEIDLIWAMVQKMKNCFTQKE